MYWRPRGFFRFRPRLMTLAVLFVTAATLVLANLSGEFTLRGPPIANEPKAFEVGEPDDGRSVYVRESYGWPILWRQQFVASIAQTPSPACYSATRLAANVIIWAAMLAVAVGVSEWLLRRYRPRLRWGLKAMFGAVALLALCCGWFAAARERADAQDPVIDALRGPGDWDTKSVFVERWGPRWLEVVGAGRYCQRVVGAAVMPHDRDDAIFQAYPELLQRLRRLRRLRYLFCNLDPALADALADKQELQVLRISGLYCDDDGMPARQCLAVIGTMTQLEHLKLEWMKIDVENLALLGGLKRLKSLALPEVFEEGKSRGSRVSPLAHLPALPRLEALDLNLADIGDGDLHFLASFPGLKSLNLQTTDISSAGLSQLAVLPALEELAVDSDILTPSGLVALCAVRSLKKVHAYCLWPRQETLLETITLDDGCEFKVPADEITDYRLAFESLRRSHPGIVIDGENNALHWREDQKAFSNYPYRWTADTTRHGFFRAWQLQKERE
jgi:hypothetical protein